MRDMVNKEDQIANSVIEGDRETVEKLLLEGVSANVQVDGLSLLMNATENRNLAMVELLIEYGADVNFVASHDHCEGQTPIFNAINDPECLEAILRNGAKVDYQRTDTGDTPLHVCASSPLSMVESASLLLNYNADISIKNDEGKTPMDVLLEFPVVAEYTPMYELFKSRLDEIHLQSLIQTSQDSDNLKF